jgi:outer membrane protein assembly factor BamB
VTPNGGNDDRRLGRRGALGLGAAVLTGLAGCGARSGSGTGVGAGTEAAGAAERARTATAADADGEPPAPEVVWRRLINGNYAIDRPVVAAGSVIFQSDSLLYALDPTDGGVAWSTDLRSAPNRYSPALADGRVVAAGRNSPDAERRGSLSALDPETGAVEWRVPTDAVSEPAVSSAGVVLATDPDGPAGGVRTVGLADGASLWTFTVPDGSYSNVPFRPTVADGTVYVAATLQTEGGTGGALYALDAATGAKRWRRRVEGRPDARPVVADGTVYLAGNSGGALRAFDATTGTERWADVRRTGTTNYWVTPTVADGAVFAGNVGGLRAYDAATGAVRWDVRNNRLSGNGVVVRDGVVYSAGRSLFALAAAEGTTRWSFEMLERPSTAFSPPAFVDGVAYVGSCLKERPDDPYDHVIFALRDP